MSKDKKWIISLGFSEADADNFIKFETADWKIEELANRLMKPKSQVEEEVAPAPKRGRPKTKK